MFKSTTYTIATDDIKVADLLILAGDFDTAKFYLRRYVGDLDEMATCATAWAEGADEVSFVINGKRYDFVARDDADGFWLIPEDGEPEVIPDYNCLMTRLYRQGEVSVTVRG